MSSLLGVSKQAMALLVILWLVWYVHLMLLIPGLEVATRETRQDMLLPITETGHYVCVMRTKLVSCTCWDSPRCITGVQQ